MQTLNIETETIPGFSCVEMMRKIRDEQDKIIGEMSYDELRRYLDKQAEIRKKEETEKLI